MNFNLGSTKGASEANKVLTAGIHNAKFLGVEKDTITSRAGDTYDVMSLKLDVDGYGEWSQNFFEPTSDERTDNQWGGKNPSQVDHFLIAVREILGALDPKIVEAIDNDQPITVGDKQIKLGGSFSQIISIVKALTKSHIGDEVEVKLIPQSNGFVSIPTFCARITRAGNVGIQTTFIGHNLTISPAEQKRIDNANHAAPTNMASTAKTNSMVDGMKDALDIDTDSESKDSDDDLPF